MLTKHNSYYKGNAQRQGLLVALQCTPYLGDLPFHSKHLSTHIHFHVFMPLLKLFPLPEKLASLIFASVNT